jgi:hypothetical protein
VVLAVEGGFVAEKEFGGAGRAGELASEGEKGSDGGGSDGWVLKGHVAVERGFLSAEDAEGSPLGSGHGFDELELGRGLGPEFFEEVVEEIEEALLGFFGEDDGGG